MFRYLIYGEVKLNNEGKTEWIKFVKATPPMPTRYSAESFVREILPEDKIKLDLTKTTVIFD